MGDVPHGYTRHGHAIPGVVQDFERRPGVHRCGGPRICASCAQDCVAAHPVGGRAHRTTLINIARTVLEMHEVANCGACSPHDPEDVECPRRAEALDVLEPEDPGRAAFSVLLVVAAREDLFPDSDQIADDISDGLRAVDAAYEVLSVTCEPED